MQPAAAFVHDFIDIGLDVDAAARALRSLADDGRLSDLVEQSWRNAASADGARKPIPCGARHDGDGDGVVPPPALRVEIGPGRHRGDTLVTPISWSTGGDGGPPRFDADFELSPYGPHHSHLHVFGRIRRGVGTEDVSASHPPPPNAAVFLRRLLATVSSAVTTPPRPAVLSAIENDPNAPADGRGTISPGVRHGG